jgi:prephenate dehydrogenase
LLQHLRRDHEAPLLIAAAALCTSVPIAAAGEFIAKYRPGCSAQAATSAVTATKPSSSMPP